MAVAARGGHDRGVKNRPTRRSLLAGGAALVALAPLRAFAQATDAMARGLAITDRSGGTMPGFLSAMCVVDRRVQAITGAGLVGLAAFAATTLLV